MFNRISTSILLGTALIAASQVSVATGNKNFRGIYEVSITNITKGQTFTPQLVTTHSRSISLFTLGKPASDELATLAESGNTEPLTNALLASGKKVTDVASTEGLLAPGQTSTIQVGVNRRGTRLSIAGMLIPTNDTFVAANGLRLPLRGSVTYDLRAYDAGSEFNDQDCANIPGPRCGGEGSSPAAETDEGYVYVSNGIHFLNDGVDELSPAQYTWQNPVATVTIKRIY